MQPGASASPLGLILQHAYGFWASATLATGFRHRIFEHLAAGNRSVEGLASAASISPRGCQALLDGLLGMGLLERLDGGYANVAALEPYLVPDSADYLGGYADSILATLSDWSKLPDVVATGRPLHRREGVDPGSSFWESTVRGIAPVAFAPARVAAERLGLAQQHAFRALDVGGGAGAYAVVWLAASPLARCVQIDAPRVNAIARDYVAEFGCGDRFEAIDGDMEELELEPASFDYAIYSNVSHGLSPARNIAMLRKIKRWLRPGGTLVLSCLVPNADRTGAPLLLLSSLNLLLNSEAGMTYVGRDYENWLRSNGFERVEFVPVPDSPSTLIFAT